MMKQGGILMGSYRQGSNGWVLVFAGVVGASTCERGGCGPGRARDGERGSRGGRLSH